jgi:hypothetical protein
LRRFKSPGSDQIAVELIQAGGEISRSEDVVQVGEAEVESSQNVVHKPLKRLGGGAQTEGHEGKLEKAEWSGDCCLLHMVRMEWDLVVRTHQVDLGEDGTSEKLVGVIVNMMDGLAVWDCPGVEYPVVAARAPTVVFLGYDV